MTQTSLSADIVGTTFTPLSPHTLHPKGKFINKRGSQLITMMFNNIFYGVAMAMVVQYFMNHSHRDTVSIKLVVCVMVISATLEVFFANAQMYDILIVSFGNMDTDGDIQFSVLGKYTTTFFTAFIAQMFYASRIWSIGINMGYMGRKIKFLAAPVAVFSALQLGAGLAQVTIMHISVTFKRLAIQDPQLIFQKIVAVQGGASATCDILITVSISFILQKSRSGIRRTDSLRDSLIKYAIQRAAATSICGVLTIFLYHYSNSYIFNLPCLINTDFHVMSVISLLIARETIREKLSRPQEMSGVVLSTRWEDLEDEDQEAVAVT